MYLFTWPSPGYGGKFGAVHGTDVPLVVGNVHAQGITGMGPVAKMLGEKMSTAWAAFAKTGNPNHPGIPQWPAYTPEARATMIFDSNSRVENDPWGDLRRLWDDVKA
jgi:para-nitrobenzyl esterase